MVLIREEQCSEMKTVKPSFKKIGGKIKSVFGRIWKNKKSRMVFIIALIIVIVLAAVLGKYIIARRASGKSQSVTSKVTRGSISNVIEGTGTVEAISQYEITSLAKGDVIADYFEEGDYVEKDQLLYQIDSASVDKNIQKQQSSISKSKMSYDDAVEDFANLNVKSTIGGVITAMYVSVGDNVQSGAKIADVIDKDNLKLVIPFGEDDARYIYTGQSASVTLANSLTTLSGTVASVGTGTYTNSYGVNVTDVEISVKNPGTVSEGELATAKIGSLACYDSGTLEYGSTKTITAKVSGEVEQILKKKGDAVSNGTVIVRLSNSTASKNVTEARLSLNDANLSLDDLYDDLDDYNIKAPISGEVIQKNVKAGEKLDTNSTSIMAIIADLSTLTFDISIDELDISSVSVGQQVSIQADAIENKTFTGTVSKISIVGESYQGVTSYPVTVTIDNSEETGLIPGMNVSAQITVESVENVLRIPVSAVRRGNLVIVKDDGTFSDNITPPSGKSQNSEAGSKAAAENSERSDSREDDKTAERMKNMLSNMDIPDGYTAVRVETGINDGSFIEIKETEGSLKEGDEVLLPDITASSDSSSEQQQGMGAMGGMPGGMGGMPGGGMPGGGMPGAAGGNRSGSATGSNRSGGSR